MFSAKKCLVRVREWPEKKMEGENGHNSSNSHHLFISEKRKSKIKSKMDAANLTEARAPTPMTAIRSGRERGLM